MFSSSHQVFSLSEIWINLSCVVLTVVITVIIRAFLSEGDRRWFDMELIGVNPH